MHTSFKITRNHLRFRTSRVTCKIKKLREKRNFFLEIAFSGRCSVRSIYFMNHPETNKLSCKHTGWSVQVFRFCTQVKKNLHKSEISYDYTGEKAIKLNTHPTTNLPIIIKATPHATNFYVITIYCDRYTRHLK